jgi:hypothetical protein
MVQQTTDIHTMSYHLWRRALAGDSDGVLLALENTRWEELPLLTADLLARLYVRKGRLTEARIIWERILQVDPHYPPAVEAVNKLDSGWLIGALAKKYSLWFGVGGLLLFALYGLGMLLVGNNDPSFALTGVAVILTVLALYLAGLAGLFGWACTMVLSPLGFDRDLGSPRVPPGRGR